MNFKELGQKYNTDKVTHHGYNYFYPRYLESFRNDHINKIKN